MLGFSIARWLGIPLGVISLLLLSTHAFNVHYIDVFQELLTFLENEVGPYFEPLENFLKQIVAWCGFELHLQNHWRYAFALLWLLLGSLAKLLSTNFVWPSRMAFVGMIGIISLVTAAAVGTVPLNSVAVIDWSIAGMTAAACFTFAVRAYFDRGTDNWYVGASASFVNFLISSYNTYLGYAFEMPQSNNMLSLRFGDTFQVPAPGILDLITFAAFFGILLLLIGIGDAIATGGISGNFWRRLRTGVAVPAIDILGTLGLALGIGYAMSV